MKKKPSKKDECSEHTIQPDGTWQEMWAWWSNERKDYSHIYPKRICVELCSPDGFKKDIKEGRGEIVHILVVKPKAS